MFNAYPDSIGRNLFAGEPWDWTMAGSYTSHAIIEPEQLAATVVEALRKERFHVLPHPEVEDYVRRKGDDIDRWLVGMRRLRRRALELGE